MSLAARIAEPHEPRPAAPPRIRLTDAQRQKLIEHAELALGFLARLPGDEPSEVVLRIDGRTRRITTGASQR